MMDKPKKKFEETEEFSNMQNEILGMKDMLV